MKKNVKNGNEAVKPKPILAGPSVIPFFISSLINGNYSCLENHLSIASLNLWVKHESRDKKNSLSCAKEFGSFIPDADHLKNKLSITNITMVIKQKLFIQPAPIFASGTGCGRQEKFKFLWRCHQIKLSFEQINHTWID